MENSIRPALSRDQQGFSLVELMVVVAIIGILAAIAIPRYTVFQIKARQSEAKQNLSNMYLNQVAYRTESGKFAAFSIAQADSGANAVNFQIKAGRYNYLAKVISGGVGFVGAAISKPGTGGANPGCAKKDAWSVDDTKCVCAFKNTAKSCADNNECGQCNARYKSITGKTRLPAFES